MMLDKQKYVVNKEGISLCIWNTHKGYIYTGWGEEPLHTLISTYSFITTEYEKFMFGSGYISYRKYNSILWVLLRVNWFNKQP